MAAIHGSPVSGTIYSNSNSNSNSDSVSDRMRGMDPGKRPPLKRAGTRKRLGTVVQAMLESMAQAHAGAADQSTGRARADSRQSSYKLRRQIYSLLDLLAAGRERELSPKDALHQLLGIVATQKFGTSWERTAQPFIDGYFRNAAREDILVVLHRLNELEGATSVWAMMDETNRQDVRGVMAVLKRAALGELAGRGIGVSLGMLAGSLGEPQPDLRLIAKAWLMLEDGVREAAYKERVPPIDYLQGGLERLPRASTRVLAIVLAPRVPSQARMARYMLETAIDDTQHDPRPQASGPGRLDAYMVSEAVRLHAVSCMERKIAETVTRLENAVRPGVRTAEVANREWHDIRRLLDTLGWIYLQGGWNDHSDETALIDAAAEQQFAGALMAMPPRTAAAFLERVDTERLLTMCAHLDRWGDEQRDYLTGPLHHACAARFHALLDNVQSACTDLEKALGQDRRIATANALLALSDALGRCERFALRTAKPSGWREDPHIDAVILRAAGSLRMPGEPGNMLGQPSLLGLGDEAFADLRRIDDPQVTASLVLDPVAVAAEMQRRVAHRDAAVDARLRQLSDLLRSPAVAPRPFVAIIASVAMADMARLEMMTAFRDGSIDHAMNAVSPALNREIGMMLYRRDGAMPVQWMEARRHIAGLLDALRQIRMAAGHGGADQEDHHLVMGAQVDTAIAILGILGRHFGISTQGATTLAAFAAATDPYWNSGCLVEIAPFFGLRYEPALPMAFPLCGAMHRARLLAALAMRMAQPAQSGLQSLVAQVEGDSRPVQVDKEFHNAAYRRGELSLSVAGTAWAPTIVARAAAAGSEFSRQSPSSLNGQCATLASFGDGTDVALTRLMSAVAQGAADFVCGARELPDIWRSSRIPEPQTLRHIHFDVSQMPRGGYRLDVSACLETSRPDMEVHLSFAMRVNATAGRVTSLIVPPEARLLPAIAPATGDVAAPAVTTTGIKPLAQGPVSDRALLTAGA